MSKTWSGGWAQGISLDKSDNSTISNNNVYDNWGEGVGAMFTKGAKITGNKVYDTTASASISTTRRMRWCSTTPCRIPTTPQLLPQRQAGGRHRHRERERRPHAAVVGHRGHRQRSGRRRQSGLQRLWRQHGLGELDDLPNTIYSSPDSVPSSTPTPISTPFRAVIRSPRQRMYSRSTRPSAGMSKSFPTSMWPLTRLPWITASLRNCPGQANYRTGSSP